MLSIAFKKKKVSCPKALAAARRALSLGLRCALSLSAPVLCLSLSLGRARSLSLGLRRGLSLSAPVQGHMRRHALKEAPERLRLSLSISLSLLLAASYTYADVCWRMLAYADVCSLSLSLLNHT